ncbi:MAG: DNA/RNA non-specific endonuclease [Tannerella sp.]|jgi:endonuclease G|nr:DNA/RNA non-specific endonuclease [Tannerella sp.]
MSPARKKQPSRKRGKKKAKARRSGFGWIVFIFLTASALIFAYQYVTVRQQEQKTAAVACPDLEIPQSLSERREQIISHTGYTVSYNEDWRLPNWVAYELTRAEALGKEKRSGRFTPDPAVEGTSAANRDYLRSGYDKGHLAPAADMKWSVTAMQESFYFTNICPQHPRLNRRGWKDLEEMIRERAIADSVVVIVCGPLVEKNAKTIGDNRVTVPQGFFKVLLLPCHTPPQAIGFVFGNEAAPEPLQRYAVTVDSVETLTSLDFFAPLPDGIENQAESRFDISCWGF